MTQYENRELSWLKFNARILAECENELNPLLERFKFLSIVSSNLDEFFMVRVGSLTRASAPDEKEKRDMSGMTSAQQLRAIYRRARRQTERQYAMLNKHLTPQLEASGFALLAPGEWSEEQRTWLSSYFDQLIKPVLTPRALDPKRSFPLLAAKALHILALGEGGQELLVTVPGGIPRVILLPMGGGRARAALAEDVIMTFLDALSGGVKIVRACAFRITRNTDFIYDDHDPENLITEMRKTLRKQSYGQIVRVEYKTGTDERLLSLLRQRLRCKKRCYFAVEGPLDLKFYMKELHGLEGFEALRYPPFTPYTDERLRVYEPIFRVITRGDLFFQHPYDSFDPIVRFVREAADDPNVLAIKQTLYRVSGKSPIVAALLSAARAGKQVTVLVEVRARFDEENNINWCQTLEKAGCHVIDGLPGLKTHSKITMVVRREETGLRRYVHLGTGNYNDVTARQYTDMGILTCDRQLGEDAGAFFNAVTGYGQTEPMQELVAAPDRLRLTLERLIRREIENARSGLVSGIVCKMNALVDKGMIDLLTEAAKAGVSVDLIVRGICCLRIRNTENLRVRSIVGRFLEHSRVYSFENGGAREIYLASADMMPRNLDKRIELMFPVKDRRVAQKVYDILRLQLSDTRGSWYLTRSGRYRRAEQSVPPVDCQKESIRE